jgi:intein/homing endonuclease
MNYYNILKYFTYFLLIFILIGFPSCVRPEGPSAFYNNSEETVSIKIVFDTKRYYKFDFKIFYAYEIINEKWFLLNTTKLVKTNETCKFEKTIKENEDEYVIQCPAKKAILLWRMINTPYWYDYVKKCEIILKSGYYYKVVVEKFTDSTMVIKKAKIYKDNRYKSGFIFYIRKM